MEYLTRGRLANHRITFIRRAQKLGFSLSEIGELLSLRLDPQTPCATVKTKAEAKLQAIEDKLNALQEMKQVLIKLTGAYSKPDSSMICPILEVFNTRNGTASSEYLK